MELSAALLAGRSAAALGVLQPRQAVGRVTRRQQRPQQAVQAPALLLQQAEVEGPDLANPLRGVGGAVLKNPVPAQWKKMAVDANVLGKTVLTVAGGDHWGR